MKPAVVKAAKRSQQQNSPPTAVRLLHDERSYLTSVRPSGLTSYALLLDLAKRALDLPANKAVTLKWCDSEGDACTVSSDRELAEAVRLMPPDDPPTFWVLPGAPASPGQLCPGEAPALYRQAAVRQAREILLLLGHALKSVVLAPNCGTAGCRVCGGRGGCLRCERCRLLVHLRCSRLLRTGCPGADDLRATAAGTADAMTLPSSKLSKDLQESVRKSYIDSGVHSGCSAEGVEEMTDRFHTEAAITDEAMVNLDQQSKTDTSESAHQAVKQRPALSTFNLLRVVGRGTFGKVLHVEHKYTKRHYAMKIVKKATVKSEDDVEWVHTEKSVFEQATNHPFLVGLHSCFQTDNRLFFIIEFVSGGDLMYHMQRHHKLPESSARFYAAEVSCALHFLHERGIVYRDLKLDNVLLEADGHIKLTDFGMCKQNVSDANPARTFCGTPNYIAPEVIAGQPYGIAVDFWALGVMLYEMLTGRSPWWRVGVSGGSQEDLFRCIAEDAPIRPPAGLSRPAIAALTDLLRRRPADRLGGTSPAEFAALPRHPFFQRVGNWQALEARMLKPPKRSLASVDEPAFDAVFTTEPARLTAESGSIVSDQGNRKFDFDGFDYVNPLLLLREDSV